MCAWLLFIFKFNFTRPDLTWLDLFYFYFFHHTVIETDFLAENLQWFGLVEALS